MTDVVKDLNCSSLEERDLVGLYVTDQLSEADAEAFEKHYFGCDRCWSEVQRATEIRAALAGSAAAQKPSPEPAANVVHGPWENWRWLAAAAAVVAAIAGALVVVRRPPPAESSMATLVAAVGPRRPVEPRLVGFPYRSREAVTRGETTAHENDPQWRKLVAAADRVEAAAKERPSSEAARAAAVARLLLGDFVEAVDGLEKLSRSYPLDARVWSDLSAAYYSRAQSNRRVQGHDGRIEDLENAVMAAEKAIALDHSLADALFNRALAISALVDLGRRTPKEAADAWDRYLALDRGSGWAREAKEHLEGIPKTPESQLWQQERPKLDQAALRGDLVLANEIVKRFPQGVRLHAEEELFPTWSKAKESGNTSEAANSLRVLNVIGRALASTSGDMLLGDAVRLVQQASEGGESRLLSALISGHRDYGVGQQFYRALAIDKALEAQRAAERNFLAAESPFAGLAKLTIASCAFYQNDLQGARRELNTIERTFVPRAKNYPAFLGKFYWLTGLVQLGLGDPNGSLASYTQSVSLFRTLNDLENTASVESLLAECFTYLADRDSAAEHQAAALSLLNRLGPSARLHGALGSAADDAIQEGRPAAALPYIATALVVAQLLGEPALQADCYFWRAAAYNSLRQSAASRSNIDDGRSVSQQIADSGTRRRFTALFDLVEGEQLADTSPREAVGRLTAALAFFDHSASHFRLAKIRLERGRLLSRLQHDAEATADFDAGFREFERQRGGLQSENLRISYFEQSRALTEELVRACLRNGRAAAAFEYVERARALALSDSLESRARPWAPPAITSARGASLGAQAIATTTSPGLAVIEYYVLSDRLVTWVITRGRLTGVEVPVSSEVLRRAVSDAVAELAANASRTGSERLYDLLVRPVLHLLDHGTPLVLIPDAPLEGFPFAALRDRETGRYLVEDFEIALAPSARILTRRLSREQANYSPRAILVVANPQFDQRRFPRLPSLPGAEREASRIAAGYSKSWLLTGAAATKRNILTWAPRAEVVHFAAHALVNEPNPDLSCLLVAEDSESPGSDLLYAHELSKSVLQRARVVVLAACRTSRGPQSAVEGTRSLARAVLRTGVDAVIASLWDVSDDTAAALLPVFHERLRKMSRPASALRLAQLSLLDNPDPRLSAPAAWGSFQVIYGRSPL